MLRFSFTLLCRSRTLCCLWVLLVLFCANAHAEPRHSGTVPYSEDQFIEIRREIAGRWTVSTTFEHDASKSQGYALNRLVRRYLTLSGVFSRKRGDDDTDLTLRFRDSLFGGGIDALATNRSGEVLLRRKLDDSVSREEFAQAILDYVDAVVRRLTGQRSVLRTVVLYVEQDGTKNSRFILTDLAGTQKKELFGSTGVLAFPAWSPDGQSFIYTLTDRLGARIIKYDMRSATHSVVGHFKNSTTAGGSWDPNGASIITAVAHRGGSRLYRLSTIEANRVLSTLTKGPVFHSNPHVSPDGRSLLYSATRRNNSVLLSTMNLQSRRSARFGVAGSHNVEPRWSPNGNLVLYSRRGAGGLFQLFLANSQGKDLRQLTRRSGSAEQTSWAFDSQQVLYTHQQARIKKVFVLSVLDGKRRRLTRSKPEIKESHPAWNPIVAPDFFK